MQCSLSQVGRQSFPHRPTHLNWFRPSSRAPPHSGQMQFTMADLTFAFDRIKLSTSNSFTERKTGLSRGQSAHNICDALDFGAFLLATVRGLLHAFPKALLNYLSESHASSGKPCLHCSAWYPEEVRRFANAQTIDIAQSKGCAQSGREPHGRMSQCFRNLSLAICLFGIWSGVRHQVCRGEILPATGFIQSDLHLWKTPTQLRACGINDDRRQPRGHLRPLNWCTCVKAANKAS